MSAPVISPATSAQLSEVLRLNQAALPHVGTLTLDALRALADKSCYFRVAHVDGKLAGFLLALAPGQSYQSLNYRWFVQRYQHFVYVDRIVIADQFHGMGIGRMFYQDVERTAPASSKWVTCEVNLLPPNPGSLAFHQKLGFSEAGQLETEGGKKRVSLLIKPCTQQETDAR